MIATGKREHLVTLQTSTTAANADSDYTTTWTDVSPATAWVAIEPATAQRLERIIPGTVISQATHIVTMPYIAAMKTTKARVVFGSRHLNVVGWANPEERNEELILVCSEVTA